MNAPVTLEQFESLRRLDGCTLANAIETFQERLRNEGFVDHTVRCLFPRLSPLLGYAATIKIRGSAPPTAHPGPKATGPATAVTVAPDLAMAGHVVRVNATARYAILGFPIGSMPLNGLRMGVYREGRRVGEVKVSGPQRDDHTVADIMQGDCQVGDEVRDR